MTSLADAHARYLRSLRARHAARGTLVAAELILPRFFALVQRRGVRNVESVREVHVVAFARELAHPRARAKGPLAVSTQGHYLSVVKAFLGFLAHAGTILGDPAAQVPLPRRQRLPRALSERAARRVVNAPLPTLLGRRDRAVLEVLYGTGLRLTECVQLDLADLDLVGETLRVRQGKGRKDRNLPLTGRALAAVGDYLSEVRPRLCRVTGDVALFLTRHGRRLGAVSISVLVRRYGRAAGVAASTHVLRHSYATHLLRGGANPREVQLLLGHTSLETTAQYLRLDIRTLAVAVRRAHPRRR